MAWHRALGRRQEIPSFGWGRQGIPCLSRGLKAATLPAGVSSPQRRFCTPVTTPRTTAPSGLSLPRQEPGAAGAEALRRVALTWIIYCTCGWFRNSRTQAGSWKHPFVLVPDGSLLALPPSPGLAGNSGMVAQKSTTTRRKVTRWISKLLFLIGKFSFCPLKTSTTVSSRCVSQMFAEDFSKGPCTTNSLSTIPCLSFQNVLALSSKSPSSNLSLMKASFKWKLKITLPELLKCLTYLSKAGVFINNCSLLYLDLLLFASYTLINLERNKWKKSIAI